MSDQKKIMAGCIMLPGHPRVHLLNRKELNPHGSHVLYWMQSAQRISYNPALQYAIDIANSLELPVKVLFCIMPFFPEANTRHFSFMLQGMRELWSLLQSSGLNPTWCLLPDFSMLPDLCREAAITICDGAYLRHQRQWREELALRLDYAVHEIDSETIVPVRVASDHAEYSAATIRRKINRQLNQWLTPFVMPAVAIRDLSRNHNFNTTPAQHTSLPPTADELESLTQLPHNNTEFSGGYQTATNKLDYFLDHRLANYDTAHNDPAQNGASGLSPWIHFGQISSLEIALKVIDSGIEAASFLEQLIVRRELAFNYAFYNSQYDTYHGLPSWARKTLAEHSMDPRPYEYSFAEFEQAKTHDRWWNIAQQELMQTGGMHNYMRMYWGKKILEWSDNPQQAFDTALRLNNRYALDGRDPNSYTGIAWCFGLHDRPWASRPVFGSVRCMTDGGLMRKFEMPLYEKRINAMITRSHNPEL